MALSLFRDAWSTTTTSRRERKTSTTYSKLANVRSGREVGHVVQLLQAERHESEMLKPHKRPHVATLADRQDPQGVTRGETLEARHLAQVDRGECELECWVESR